MTTYSPSGSPAAAAFVFRPQRRSLGFLLSVTLHVALAAFFLWSAPVPPPVELPPPAVMLTFSADIENSQLTKPLPVGIVQAVDSAASSQQEAVQQQQKTSRRRSMKTRKSNWFSSIRNRKNSKNARNRYRKRRSARRIKPALPLPVLPRHRQPQAFPTKSPHR